MTSDVPTSASGAPRWLPDVAVAVLFVCMLAATWQRWTHPIMDHGREMNIPLRLLRGERLYVDIIYYYGPLAPYLNALLYRVFGVHLYVLHAAGLISAVASLWLLRSVARRLMTGVEAAIAIGFVIATVTFAPAQGSYIQPYAHAALYGWVGALASMECALRYLKSRQPRHVLWAGILSGVTALCKPELLVLAGTPVVIAWLVTCLAERRWLWSHAAAAAGPAIILCGVVYGALVATVPWNVLFTDTYNVFNQPQMIHFARHMSGALAWPATLWAEFAAFGLLLAAAGATAAVGVALSSGRPATNGRLSWIAGALALGVSLWWGLRLLMPPTQEANPLRSALLVLTPLIVSQLATIWRTWTHKREVPTQNAMVLIVAAFALIAIGRIVMNIYLVWPYAPFTTPPLIVLYAYLMFRVFPEWLSRTASAAAETRRVTMFALIVLLIATAGVQATMNRNHDTFVLETPRGRLLTDPAIGEPVAGAIAFAAEHTRPGQFVLSVPQGTIVNFMADRPYPLREEVIVPGFLTPDRERDAIIRLERRDVPLVLVGNWLNPEYGGEIFGLEYNRTLMQWIERHYHRVASFGEGSDHLEWGAPPFFIRAYERNP